MSFLFSAAPLSIRLIEKAGAVINACVAGLGVIGVGLLGLSTWAWAWAWAWASASMVSWGITKWLPFGAVALYFAGVPLYGPTIPTMLLQCVPPDQRGAGEYSYPCI